MKEYLFLVREVAEKYVYVIAKNEKEAEQFALETNMDKNFNNYSLDAELISQKEVKG